MKEVDCRELIENLYLWLDGELDDDRCAELEAHMTGCSDCFSRRGVEHHFKELVRLRCTEQEVPAALIERIRLALRRETAS